MKDALICVVAISLLTVVAELILQEGEMKKYIIGIVRLALVSAVVVSLIQGIFSLQVTNTDIYESNLSVVTDNFGTIEYISSVRNELYEKKLSDDFLQLGISGVKVHIVCYYDGNAYRTSSVTVDFSGTGISEETANILSIEEIKEIVMARVDIAEEAIKIYGRD